jgi:16S rRNA (uracil1498-N3)-methyltransferase
MELFFCSQIETGNFLPDEEESHHLSKVTRHSAGDELMVTDGKGKLVRAKIAQVQKKSCVLEIIEVVKQESAPSPTIHIAIAPTKNNDRFEWFLEKATEIGVTQITPVICQRSERDKIKHERLQKILIGAMKQSLRLWLPKFHDSIKFPQFVNPDQKIGTGRQSSSFNPDNPAILRDGTGQKFIAHCQSSNLPSLHSLYTPKSNVLILIGPEGDFTLEEIQLAESSGFSAVNLGRNRLRTETAGIIAVHTIQLMNC